MNGPEPAPLPVHLWWADLTQGEVSLARALPLAERERVMAPERPADRGRRLVAAALLQHAVSHGPGRRPAGPVEIDRTCAGCGRQHGRPVVEGGPHLSVAHAGVLVVVATCAGAMVGVDVERTARFGGSVDETLAWARHESEVKAGVEAPGATSMTLRAPLTGYAAALCVATGGQVSVTEHHVTL